MTRWVAGVVGAMALLAVAALPPRGLEGPDGPERELVEEARYRALVREAALPNELLRRMRRAELVVRRTLDTPGRIVVSLPEEADDSLRSSIGERVRGDLAAAGAVEPAVSVGYFLLPFRDGGHPGAPGSGSGLTTEYYAGVRDGRAFCAVVEPVARSDGRILTFLPRPPHTLLGPCGLAARFGLPGEAVAGWLAQGASAYASATALGPDERGGWYTPEAPGAPGRRDGRRNEREARLAIPERRCLAGRLDACSTLFRDGRTRSPEPAVPRPVDPAVLIGRTALSAVEAHSAFEPLDLALATDLRAEFGEERFARFWRADGGSVEEAFRAAFGVEAGTWYAARLARHAARAPAGPLPAAADGAWVLAALLFAGLAGAAWATRRRLA